MKNEQSASSLCSFVFIIMCILYKSKKETPCVQSLFRVYRVSFMIQKIAVRSHILLSDICCAAESKDA